MNLDLFADGGIAQDGRVLERDEARGQLERLDPRATPESSPGGGGERELSRWRFALLECSPLPRPQLVPVSQPEQ